MRIRPAIWGIVLLGVAGCATGGGVRLPFGGGGDDRAAPESAPPPGAPELLARIDTLRLEVAQLERLLRQTRADLTNRIAELARENRRLQDRWDAFERRLNAAAQPLAGRRVAPETIPGPTYPALERSVAVLDSAAARMLGPTGRPRAEAGRGEPGRARAGDEAPSTAGAVEPERADGEPSPDSAEPEPGGGDSPRTEVEPAPPPAGEGHYGDPPEEARRLYQVAYQDLMQDNFQLALINFRAFLEHYPQTTLSDNARYWLGEVYYEQRQFAVAIEEFRRVIEDFPGAEKVPAAYYKTALCFANLGDRPTARRYLEYLREHFPDSREAQLAEQQLGDN